MPVIKYKNRCIKFKNKAADVRNRFELTLEQTNGGLLSSNKLSGWWNDEVTLYNTPSAHYDFNGYSITGSTLYDNNKFKFNGSSVSAEAIFTPWPVRNVSLVQTSGGTINASPMTGYDGDTVVLTNEPSSHFSLNSYGLTGATLEGDSFVFNGSNVTANAIWQQDPIYTVLLNQTAGGTITATPTTGFSGDVITLNATANAHYSLTGWGVTGATLTGDQLTIGSSNPSVVGKFQEDTKYNLTLQQSTGGTITANKLTGYSNDTITLSNTPSSNYVFNSYSLTGATLTGSKFKFGTSNVTAKANFKTLYDVLYYSNNSTVEAPKGGNNRIAMNVSNITNTTYLALKFDEIAGGNMKTFIKYNCITGNNKIAAPTQIEVPTYGKYKAAGSLEYRDTNKIRFVDNPGYWAYTNSLQTEWGTYKFILDRNSRRLSAFLNNDCYGYNSANFFSAITGVSSLYFVAYTGVICDFGVKIRNTQLAGFNSLTNAVKW